MGGPRSGRKKETTNKQGTKKITAKNQQNVKNYMNKLYKKAEKKNPRLGKFGE